jgi:hypothetical protein
MDEAQVAEIMRQHIEILVQIKGIWIALVIGAILALAFLGLMMYAAAWSVTKVNEQTAKLILTETRERKELEAKFTLLIDALIGRIGRRGDI